MRKELFLFFVTMIILISSINQLFCQDEGSQKLLKNRPETYEELYDQLTNIKPDNKKVAIINDFKFNRDAGFFHLKQGEFVLLEPINSRYVAAVFIGNGEFSCSPPTKIEQDQLYRFFETNFLVQEFKALFLIFSDSTILELENHLNFINSEFSNDTQGYIDEAMEYLIDEDEKYFDTSIMKTLLDDMHNDQFYAHIFGAELGPLFFEIDPFSEEPVKLSHRKDTGYLYKISEVVCQFQKETYQKKLSDDAINLKNIIKVNHYNIETSIKDNLDFSGNTEVKFESLMPDQKWIYFILYDDLEVDSVFSVTNERLNFFKGKENSICWIQLNTPLQKNDIQTVKIFYHGDLLERNQDGWIYIKGPDEWFPRYGGRTYSTFDLTFHTPEKMTFVSVGDKIFSETDNEMITTKWEVKQPIRNASFNIGFFEEYKIEDDRVPPIIVLKAELGEIWHIFGARGMEKEIGGDIANSLAFFNRVFGKLPLKQFYVTEIPYLHGEAFPGLIHLSWVTYQQTGNKGYHEIFRAHEVAHQWWGIGVDYETYHDKWLSEGLSNYAGLWYMQMILKDNEKFFNVLDDWHESISNNRKYIFGSGQEAGPICLGYRTSSSRTPGDFGLIVYQKGAWVLHMLRIMMIDLKTMNEDRFTNMLKDFFNIYKGKKVTTLDFQQIVEKHARTKMDWFFNQWIFETDIPTYQFGYEVEDTPEGKYLLKCKVKQLNVPENFYMNVPIQIDFGENRLVRIAKPISGKETKFELLLPMEPNEIEFNYLKAVLAEVENIDYDD